MDGISFTAQLDTYNIISFSKDFTDMPPFEVLEDIELEPYEACLAIRDIRPEYPHFTFNVMWNKSTSTNNAWNGGKKVSYVKQVFNYPTATSIISTNWSLIVYGEYLDSIQEIQQASFSKPLVSGVTFFLNDARLNSPPYIINIPV